MSIQINLENKEASYCSKVIWKEKFEKIFYLSLENYNGKLRDDFFRETIEILNSNFNQSFYIGGGTLLGFIRESDFIEWDDNIDLLFNLNEESLNNLIKLQSIFLEKNYVARIIKKKNYLKLSLYKHGYKIDLCSYLKIKNFYLSNEYKFPVDCLEQFKIVKFKGTKVNIPSKYEKYLNYIYGDWKTPKKNNYGTVKSTTIVRVKASLFFYKIKHILQKIIDN